MPDSPTALHIKLPLPDKRLHPNGGARHNVHAVNRLRKACKERAWAETLSAMGRRTLEPGPLAIDWHFFLANGRAKHGADLDNLRSWMKSYQDGIAIALDIDDREFRDGMVMKDVDKDEPCVRACVRRYYESEESNGYE